MTPQAHPQKRLMEDPGLNAALDRFVRLVKTTDVWSHDLTEAYDALCEALGVVPLPAMTYAAAHRLAARLEEVRQTDKAEKQRINLKFLDALKRAKRDDGD